MLRQIVNPYRASLRLFASKKAFAYVEKTADDFAIGSSKFISFEGKLPELDTAQLDMAASKILGALENEHKKIIVGRASPSTMHSESFFLLEMVRYARKY